LIGVNHEVTGQAEGTVSEAGETFEQSVSVFVWQQRGIDVMATVDAAKMPGEFSRSGAKTKVSSQNKQRHAWKMFADFH
jgi:hypothetical protein